jgi:transposase
VSGPIPGCPGCAALQARVQELEAQAARLPEREAQVATLSALVTSLQAQVAELTARLHQDSQNSSRPPSSDPPWQARPPQPGSGRPRGGQRGHRGTTRAWVAPEHLTARHDYFPPACGRCGTALPPAAGPTDPAPRRHQVWEVPIAPPEITEHRCHGRYCPACGRLTWAVLPPDVSRSGQGPRLEAVLGLLTGAYRVSRRGAAALVQDLFGVPVCAATVSRVEARLTAALAAVYAALGRALAAATQLNVDETPWWEAGRRSWLWTAATREVVFYRIDAERSRAALERLLSRAREAVPELLPVLGSDRYSAYGHWEATRHQHCLAHVARDLEAAAQRGGLGQANAAWAQEDLARVFAAWGRYRRGELAREDLQAELLPVQQSFRAALELGEQFGTGKQRGLFRTLLKEWERLWVFLNHEGVEPTNNRAEQALRGAVIWRKTSYGSQSERGRCYVERMLSVVGTARLQGRNVLAFLTELLRAHQAGQPAPTLVSA